MSTAAEPITTTVSGTPPAVGTTTTAGAPAAAAPPPVDAVALQKQIDDLKEQVAESTRAAQFWADKAKTPETKPAKAAEPEEDDVLETITAKGGKGLDALLAKRGYVRAEEVEEKINTRAAQLTKEQELLGRFPDLKRKDTEFFKATAGYYGDLVKEGVPQSKAMELAADRAELEFIRSGKIKLPGAEPTKEEKETARLARIKAQGSGGDGRRPAASADEDDEGLTPEQKHIAAAMGISEEAYAKRAKAGISMGGRGSR